MKVFATMDSQKNGSVWVSEFNTKEDAISSASLQWDRLTFIEKKQRRIVACLADTDTLEVWEEFKTFE